MAALNKKGCRMAGHALSASLESLSKHALIDLVVDRARAEIGEDAADSDVIARVAEWAGPVLRVRGDRDPGMPTMFEKHKANECPACGSSTYKGRCYRCEPI
jgi:hypothetical protein